MTLSDTFASSLRRRLDQLHTDGSDTIGDMLDLELLELDSAGGQILLRCATQPWMRNLAGTLHGGMCATVVDQAMGCVAYCAKPGDGLAPTISLQVDYHRPLIPGEDVLIRIRVVSVTRSLIRLTGEAAPAACPDRLCLSCSATYFYKPAGSAQGALV